MFRNYLAAAIRNLFRDRAYAAINIFGLALGLTAVLLIGLYVRDEYSYDKSSPSHDRTYRIHTEFREQPGRAPIRVSVTAAYIARALELDFPQVEATTRVVPGGGTLKQKDVELRAFVSWADPNFFSLFPQKVLGGDPEAALKRPDGLVLTRTMARRLFNREDIVGELVSYNRTQTLRVGAVIEDLPSNTHFRFDSVASGLASFSDLAQYDQLATRTDVMQPENTYTYVRLKAGADVRKINAAMKSFAERRVRAEANGVSIAKYYDLRLVSLPELHFLPPSIADMKPPSDRRTVEGMILIAAMILFVAASNFVSMMTARAARRAVEVGVRKSVGATRRQIIVQFLGECLFYSALALSVAVIAVELLLPSFNAFLQRTIAFDFLSDRALGASIVAGWLAVGLAAGVYPALVLSLFRPAVVLKGELSLPGGPGRLRQAMVMVQFGTLVALVIATITVHRQTRFALEDQLRVSGDEVFLIPFGCIAGDTRFREIAAKVPGVRLASCASSSALAGGRFAMLMTTKSGGSANFRAAYVDTSYFGLLGISPLAGRLFDSAHGEDNLVDRDRGTKLNPTFVINESAARALGYARPEDAVNTHQRWSRTTGLPTGEFRILEPETSQLIGVVPDFTLGSVRDAIEPTGFFIDPSMGFTLLLKLDGASIPDTLKAVEAQWRRARDGQPFGGQFLSQRLNAVYADIRRQTALFSIFSAVAVVVASLGLLGLAVYTAERRTREIGVRKVMGASRWDILRFIGWQFARPVLLANLLAWPVAWFLMQRWLEGFAYHVDLGPLAFVAASALAIVIALVTVSGHALLVARAKPVEALRYE